MRRPSISLTSLSLRRNVLRHDRENDERRRRYAEHDQGQPPGIDQQHRQINKERKEIEHRVEQPARQKIANVVGLLQLVGHHARRIGVEIMDRQPQQVLDRAGSDLMVELAGDEGEQIIPQIVEAGVEEDQHADPGAQGIKRREGLVRDHLVDEQLEEDRHRERDQVHGQRRGHDVAHQGALGEQFRGEPGKAEGGVRLARRQWGDHQGVALPRPLEVGAPEEERLAVAEQRVGDGNFLRPVAPRPHQDHGIAVFEQQQDRVAERGRAQAVPIEAGAFGAQPELAGQLDQARHRHGITVDQVPPADRPDLGIDPVLRAEAEEASERRLTADDIAGWGNRRGRVSRGKVCRLGVGGHFDGHDSTTALVNCERRARCSPARQATAQMPRHSTREFGSCK